MIRQLATITTYRDNYKSQVMQGTILKNFNNLKEPVEVIVVGLGYMGLGFVSLVKNFPGLRIPLVISRRVKETCSALEAIGFKTTVQNEPSRIAERMGKGFVCVSDNLNLLKDYENDLVVSMTGTIDYESKVAIETLNAKKHLVTMNAELQATLGTELKKIADSQGVIITDVFGDQPGSLAQLMEQTQLMGFKIIMAGNMKRFLNRHATQADMKSWADDKGLSVTQVTSFTDGTKQSLEMTLVANYYDMKVLQYGMKGPKVEKIQDVLKVFDWKNIPSKGIVDYVLGKNLFQGIFIVAQHPDPNQSKYLRYLSLGDGPNYVIFEPYHLCHLGIPQTLGQVLFFGKETINNGLNPTTISIAVAKSDLKKGDVLLGIGGDSVYGNIDNIESRRKFLPIGLAGGAILKRNIPRDKPIELDDVILPSNTATKLAGLCS